MASHAKLVTHTKIESRRVLVSKLRSWSAWTTLAMWWLSAGGSAAFEAAVAARQAGADRVIMLEKAPDSEYGGNARYSGTGFRFWHRGAAEIRSLLTVVNDEYFNTYRIEPYSEADFLSDLDKMTLGRMDRTLAHTLVHESNTAVRWMKETGIRFELLKEHAEVNGARYLERGIAIHVAGGGLGQLQQWRRIAEELGVEIRFEAPVSAIRGNMHRVEGVKVSGSGGEYELSARSVVACAGGFQASPEMRALPRRQHRFRQGPRLQA